MDGLLRRRHIFGARRKLVHVQFLVQRTRLVVKTHFSKKETADERVSDLSMLLTFSNVFIGCQGANLNGYFVGQRIDTNSIFQIPFFPVPNFDAWRLESMMKTRPLIMPDSSASKASRALKCECVGKLLSQIGLLLRKKASYGKFFCVES